MGIGGSIFLIAVGAIFAFAVEFDLGWLDLRVVGMVLMLAGVVGLVLTLWFWQSRRRTVVNPVVRTTRTVPAQRAPLPPTETEQVDDRVVEERRETRRPGRAY